MQSRRHGLHVRIVLASTVNAEAKKLMVGIFGHNRRAAKSVKFNEWGCLKKLDHSFKILKIEFVQNVIGTLAVRIDNHSRDPAQGILSTDVFKNIFGSWQVSCEIEAS